MSWYVAAFLLMVIAFGVFVVISESRQRRTAERHIRQLLDSRQSLPNATLIEQCGSEVNDDLAERTLRVVAGVCEFAFLPSRIVVDAGKLRLEDDLCADLGYQLDSLAFYELHSRLEKEFDTPLEFSEFKQPPTIRDIVLMVQQSISRGP